MPSFSEVRKMERDINKDKQICKAANPGPWKVQTGEYDGEDWLIADLGEGEVGDSYQQIFITTDQVHTSEMNGDASTDAEFIVTAREALPYYIDRCDKAEKSIAYWKDMCQENEAKLAGMINQREFQMDHEDNIRNQFHLSPDVGFGDLARYLDHWMKKCKEKENRIAELEDAMRKILKVYVHIPVERGHEQCRQIATDALKTE
jgi:hypothetical protein